MRPPIFYVTGQHIMVIKYLQPDPDTDLATWMNLPDELLIDMHAEECSDEFYEFNAEIAAEFISEYSCGAFLKVLIDKLKNKLEENGRHRKQPAVSG